MRPNRFSIHRRCRYKDYLIVAEKRSLFFTMEYSLVIDNNKQDQLLGTYGIFVLHGMLEESGGKTPVQIIIHQGIIAARFFCKIEDKLVEMEKFNPAYD